MNRQKKANKAINNFPQKDGTAAVSQEEISDSGLEGVPNESNHAEDQILKKNLAVDAKNIEVVLSTNVK